MQKSSLPQLTHDEFPQHITTFSTNLLYLLFFCIFPDVFSNYCHIFSSIAQFSVICYFPVPIYHRSTQLGKEPVAEQFSKKLKGHHQMLGWRKECEIDFKTVFDCVVIYTLSKRLQYILWHPVSLSIQISILCLLLLPLSWMSCVSLTLVFALVISDSNWLCSSKCFLFNQKGGLVFSLVTLLLKYNLPTNVWLYLTEINTRCCCVPKSLADGSLLEYLSPHIQ